MNYEQSMTDGMDTGGMTEIARGAEGSVYRTSFLGRDAVVKIRSPKGYRIPELDRRIRGQRIRAEARLIRDARRAGLRTPVIYYADPEEGALVMEDVKGETVKHRLDTHPEEADELCRAIGKDIAAMHNARITHGDLTTSNMILADDGTVCFIDFSMGTCPAEEEDMGVDLRLLERAFSSAHPKLGDAYRKLLEAYCSAKTQAEKIMDKVQEIKDRGRYT